MGPRLSSPRQQLVVRMSVLEAGQFGMRKVEIVEAEKGETEIMRRVAEGPAECIGEM
jgi:hypothetical protein